MFIRITVDPTFAAAAESDSALDRYRDIPYVPSRSPE